MVANEEEIYLDLDFNADDIETNDEYTSQYANQMLELATIISEVSLKGQAIRGKHKITQICGTMGEPLYIPRKTDKRPHTWDKTSGAWCLVDSGAQLSIWPRELCPDTKKDKEPRLKAVNGTPITTYGDFETSFEQDLKIFLANPLF